MKALRIVLLYSFPQLLWLTAVCGHALDPNKRITQYQHRAWRVQDGLLPNVPDWISQTADGYPLVGGRSMGFFRFDGVRFVPWSSPIVSSPGSYDFLPAKTGGLWISDVHGLLT